MDASLPVPIPGLEVERELGRGANGAVYLARDVLLMRQVALKVLTRREDPDEEEERDAVLAEARLIARLASPHVVTLYRVHAQDGGWVLEMEYVGGGTLEDRLEEKGSLPADEVVRVISGTAQGLAAAHAARIVHGDVKPGNILFAADGTPKLADFGIARMLGRKGVVRRTGGTIAGTPFYMAPEVVRWEGTKIASDIWSLGVVAHEALTGRLPFEDEAYVELFRKIREDEPPPLPPETPPRLANLIRLCLQKDPEERPASADDVVRQLRGLSAADVRFTAAVAPPPTPTNLVPPATTFVGRSEELESVRALLDDDAVRLVTLVGPGGMGKTRLAQEAASAALGGDWPGGVWFADASESRDADGIAQAVLVALGIREAGAAAPVRRVGEILQSRPRTLVVVDNMEQVVEHALETVGAWMRQAPKAKFLVTSRAVLGLTGEQDLELEPLASPHEGLEHLREDDLAAYDAVKLFVDRARATKSDFAPAGPTLRCVARICAELDGLPLALELAAARIRMMSPEQIEANLTRKFQLLATSRKDTAARQSTLKGAIEWSFGLLSDWERDAFLQACTFVDGFSLDAAEAVIDLSSHDDAPFAFDVVQVLRDRSLLYARDAGHETRLGMYRAIREFGANRWRDSASEAQRTALAERHARYYLAFAEARNACPGGPRSVDALERVGLEVGNLTAAHRHALEAGDVESAGRLAVAVAEAMSMRRPPRELLDLTDATLARLDPAPSADRARLLVHRSAAEERVGDWERAVRDADDGLAAARAAGDPRAVGAALVQIGVMRRNRGDLAGALESWDEAVRVATAAGDRQTRAVAIGDRGMAHAVLGESEKAAACYEEAEKLARAIGDLQTAALHVCNRGVLHEQQGDRFAAIGCYRESENLARRIGDRLRVAITLGNQANVLVQHDHLEPALACYREAESIARELGARQRIAQIVGNRGILHVQREEFEEGERCLDESLSIARELGDIHRVASALRSLASLHDKRRRFDRALACVDEANAIADQIGDPHLRSAGLAIRGSVLFGKGDLQAAREAYEAALDLRTAHGTRQTTWFFKNLLQLAEILEQIGDIEAAARRAAEARAIADAMGMDVVTAGTSTRKAYSDCLRIENLRRGGGAGASGGDC